MRITTTVSLFALLGCVAACAPAGYYDSTGAYHSYGASDSYRTNTPRDNNPPPGGDRTYYDNNNGAYAAHPDSTTTVIYERPGYYDSNGYYISPSDGPGVPKRYLPPAGMCRVWFTDRPVSEEPPVESCDGIRSRVPQGAYVVYGG
jgi:hypothetical protein